MADNGSGNTVLMLGLLGAGAAFYFLNKKASGATAEMMETPEGGAETGEDDANMQQQPGADVSDDGDDAPPPPPEVRSLPQSPPKAASFSDRNGSDEDEDEAPLKYENTPAGRSAVITSSSAASNSSAANIVTNAFRQNTGKKAAIPVLQKNYVNTPLTAQEKAIVDKGVITPALMIQRPDLAHFIYFKKLKPGTPQYNAALRKFNELKIQAERDRKKNRQVQIVANKRFSVAPAPTGKRTSAEVANDMLSRFGIKPKPGKKVVKKKHPTYGKIKAKRKVRKTKKK